MVLDLAPNCSSLCQVSCSLLSCMQQLSRISSGGRAALLTALPLPGYQNLRECNKGWEGVAWTPLGSNFLLGSVLDRV